MNMSPLYDYEPLPPPNNSNFNYIYFSYAAKFTKSNHISYIYTNFSFFPIENIDKLAEFDYNKTVFVSIFSYIPPPPHTHTLKHTIQKTIYSIQKYSFRFASHPKPTQLQLQPPRQQNDTLRVCVR